MSGLHRDINAPRNFLPSRVYSRSHENEAEAERGLAQGTRPRDQGARPPLESNQDSLSGLRSTDLKDQG